MDPDWSSDLQVTEKIIIPAWELGEAFIRAGGPGGQNVNKTATAVQLRWAPERSSIPAEVKARFQKIWAARLTGEGEVELEASAHRTQGLNRRAARQRLADMVRKAAQRPKRRIATQPTRGSVKRRLEAKKRRGALKQGRKPVSPREA